MKVLVSYLTIPRGGRVTYGDVTFRNINALSEAVVSSLRRKIAETTPQDSAGPPPDVVILNVVRLDD